MHIGADLAVVVSPRSVFERESPIEDLCMRLKDRVAIVTGAGGSIGGAVCRRLASEGADVCLAARRGDARAWRAKIRALGRRAIEVRTDVTSQAANQEMVRQTVEAFGKVDILVTVAGVVSMGSAETLAEEEWDRVMAINLKGAFLSCQAVIPQMRRQRYGRIINMGSLLAKNGGNPRPWIDRSEQARAGNVAYGSAKAGVHAMTHVSRQGAGGGRHHRQRGCAGADRDPHDDQSARHHSSADSHGTAGDA